MPSDYRLNCLTNVSGKYRVEVNGALQTLGQPDTSYTYYTDGYVNIEIKVWSRNRDDYLSSDATISLTTPTGLRECL